MDGGLFGSSLRTDTLVAIGRLGETYPLELAAILERQPTEVRRAIASLEDAGIVTTRLRGRTRLTTLNPRFPAKDALYTLLLAMSEWPKYRGMWEIRRRPRATGKPL
ncbi:MAG: helix-turn-helix domain-containing protein [Candidatus Aquilonibacter sp.]